MFRQNEGHRQSDAFSISGVLPENLRSELEESWGGSFYSEVFCLIDEAIFESLYSNKASRPNAPINVLVGAEVLKSGFGWSDEELFRHLKFDLQTRYALGLMRLEVEIFDVRTLYNFRRRVREYAERTGVNLFAVAKAQVTDEQMARYGIKGTWQRVDSTQVLSNIALMDRLELVVTTVQEVFGLMSEAEQAIWEDRLAAYLSDRAQRICYRIAVSESPMHLERLGEMLLEMARSLKGEAGRLAARLLEDQYRLSEEGAAQLKPAREVAATSLQSPHDEEASYRQKGGRQYRGYVAGVSETCSPDNPVQLITDVVLAPNTTDDGALLAATLDRQAERGIGLEEVTVDGGFTGPVGEQACREHEVIMRPTRIRGRRGKADRFGWEDYKWETDEGGNPVAVHCPQGQRAILKAGKNEHFTAYFDAERCQACPFFNGPCRTVKKRRGTSLYVARRSIKVARRRQDMRDVDRSVRAVIESTIRSLKHGLVASKLPVRGLIRSQMHMSMAAMMVNARRLHRWLQSTGTPTSIFDFYQRLLDVLSVIRDLFTGRLTTASPIPTI